MSKDMMRAFELYQPESVENAVGLLGRLGSDGWALAGGNDTLDWFKDRAKYTSSVVDLSGIESLKGIRETADGIEIGALTTLTEIESSPLIQERFGILAQASGRVASPQIRNTGTIGGNVCQDTRCWYYRYGLDCYRAGGTTCYADTPEGQNREHCLWGADRCVAVTPSDTAPALVVLDAEEFFIGPEIDIERMTVLEAGDLLTAIRISNEWSGSRFYFEKVADRNTWDFPLVNIASAMVVEGGVISRIRMAAGAVQCVPKRLTVVEEVVTGSAPDEETAALAGQAAVRGAIPLNYNHFKIPLLENLVKRAIRDS